MELSATEHYTGFVNVDGGTVIIVLLQEGASLYNQTASAVKLPSQQCLLASISEHARHTLSDVTNLVVLPLDTLLALLSVTCNTVILVAILRTRSIQRPSLLLLCSLSTTDVIWAINCAIHNTKFFIFKNFCPKQWSEGEVFPVILCLFSTLGNLATVSCDRFLAVNNPWWYRSHATRSFAAKQIVLVWLIALTLSGAGIGRRYDNSTILWSIFLYLGIVFFACFALTIIVCYIGVLIANCRHGASMHLYGGPMRTVLRREKKIAVTVGLILLVVCFTVLPAMIAPLVLLNLGFRPKDTTPLRPFYYIFASLNGLLNPILNYGRNKDVRRAVRGLIRCQRCFGEGRRICDLDNGQQRKNKFPLRGNNRVTVDSHQINH